MEVCEAHALVVFQRREICPGFLDESKSNRVITDASNIETSIFYYKASTTERTVSTLRNNPFSAMTDKENFITPINPKPVSVFE